MFKKISQVIMLLVLVVVAFAGAGKAEAWSGCGPTYTVQWGDTLYQIAANCGTSMDAIRDANPGLYNWVYAGQVLVMPGGGTAGSAAGGFTYYVNTGDTLKIIAARFGTSWDVLANVNHLYDPDIIYPGQALWIPSQGYTPAPPPYYDRPDWRDSSYHPVYYTVQKGDTLIKISGWYLVSIDKLVAMNPQIRKSHLLDIGMVLRVK